MEFSMNSKAESTANAIFMFYSLHVVTNVVNSSLDVLLRRWQRVGIHSASVVNHVTRNWPIAVSFVIK